MKQPIIGITGNQRPNPKSDLGDIIWSYAPTGFIEGVKRAGGIPLILPIGDKELAKPYVSMVDKIILIGGQNVDPEFYGEENQAMEDDFFKERDIFELAIIEEATKQKKAIFSVCRGTQLMNVALGGSLHQDIENHWQDNPSDYLSHEMEVLPGSRLAQFYDKKTSVNSFHHQSIKHLASDLKVVAKDPNDGTIEAVESTNPELRFLGVQWHPELLLDARSADQKLFDYVVNEL